MATYNKKQAFAIGVYAFMMGMAVGVWFKQTQVSKDEHDRELRTLRRKLDELGRKVDPDAYKNPYMSEPLSVKVVSE